MSNSRNSATSRVSSLTDDIVSGDYWQVLLASQPGGSGA